MKKILPFLILCIFLIIVVIPLFTPTILGTADGFAHKFRVVSFVRSLKEGNLRPRWLSDEAMGYGSPIFLFNYLLPYYAVGALIISGIGIKTATQIYLALTILLSGFAMYLLARRLWGERAGIASAITYAAAPYHLLSVYIYEGWGEATAFIFPPLILYLTLQIQNSKFKIQNYNSKFKILNFALSLCTLHFALLIIVWSLFILSHNPSVLMFTPIILGITMLAERGNIRAVFPPIIAFILGVFLSAFFWLPALTMKHLINYTSLIAREMQARSVFFKSITKLAEVAFETFKKGNATYFDFTLGLPILTVGLIIVIYLGYLIYIRYKKEKIKIRRDAWLIGSAAVFFGSLYLTNSYSNWVWDNFKLLSLIVYPFRFLFPATFAGSLLLGYIGRKRTAVAVIIMVFCFVAAKPYTNPWLDIFPFTDDYFQQPHPAFFAPNTQKIMGTAEFLPATADLKHLQNVEDAYVFTKKLPDKFSFSKGAAILSQNIGVERQAVSYEAGTEQILTVATNTFPNWQAQVDGQNYTLHPDLSGRITAVVPAGRHVFTLEFGKTPIEKLADGISLVTLLGILTVIAVKKFRLMRI